MKTILKVGLVIIRDGKLLIVREKNKIYFLMPGGRPARAERELDTLEREINEELACSLDRNSVIFLGEFSDQAASEKSAVVRVRLYSGCVKGDMSPSSEIAELRWFDPKQDDPKVLAPSIRNKILPYLEQRHFL
jgi:8-oxo-dGTP diphosphatase